MWDNFTSNVLEYLNHLCKLHRRCRTFLHQQKHVLVNFSGFSQLYYTIPDAQSSHDPWRRKSKPTMKHISRIYQNQNHFWKTILNLYLWSTRCPPNGVNRRLQNQIYIHWCHKSRTLYLFMAQLRPKNDYILYMHHNISYKTWGHNEYWPVLLGDPGPLPAWCPQFGLLGQGVAPLRGLASPE